MTKPKPPAVKDTEREQREAEVKRNMGRAAGDGRGQVAIVTQAFSKALLGDTDLGDVIDVMNEGADLLVKGDTGGIERLLHHQVVALNGIFAECARRSGVNMGEHLGAAETYMRLALKAQAQCSRTAEVLATIKNPPVVFAKQANFATGPQQVNNGMPAPAKEIQNPQNEVLEDARHEQQRMDTRTTPAPARSNPAMATVEAKHRAAD